MSKIVESFQADLPTRIFRVTNGLNESIYLAANEPSLGMYRLQEHIQTNVPKVVSQKQNLEKIFQQVEGACYDLDYAKEAVGNLTSVTQFAEVSRLLESAIHYKKLLDHKQQASISPVATQLPSIVSHDRESLTSSPTVRNQATDSLTITPKSFD